MNECLNESPSEKEGKYGIEYEVELVGFQPQ